MQIKTTGIPIDSLEWLSSIKERVGCVAHDYNPNIQKAETGELRAQGQTGLQKKRQKITNTV
jgi:hypothetical protein